MTDQHEENQGLNTSTGQNVAPIPNNAPTRDETLGAMGSAGGGPKPNQTAPVDLEPYKQKLRDYYAQVKGDRQALEDTGIHKNELDVSGEITGNDNHPADQATDLFIRERDYLLEGNMDDILAQCARAMAKIEEGTYGFSDVSGAFIGADRLDAVPYATMTVEEQERVVER